MADRPSMKDGLSELFRRTDRGGAPSESGAQDAVVKGRPYVTTIKVVGIGGAGTNAINRMVDSGVKGVEFIAVNTDVQQLSVCDADVKIHIGQEITHGLGGGANPDVGREAMEVSRDEVGAALRGADLVFVTAGEGGGTGTGGAPVVAQVARELGGVTIAIVTKPFGFEGNRRLRQALEGIDALRDVADTVISIPNDRLLEVVERNTSVVEAFQHADDILRHGVQGITDLITVPGLINLDFADVRTIVKDAGHADAEERGAGVLHDGAHVGEVEVDQTGDRDEVGDALDAVAEDVVAAQRGLELVARDLHGFAPDVGVRPAAETVRDLLPDVDLDVGVAHAELLHVGVDGDELDALDARVDHAVDRVRARAADADDLDGGHVGPSFDDRVLGAALARRATPVGAPEELAQSILHARTICHSAPPARGRGTIRPLCLWDRTSAPRPRSRAPRRTRSSCA